MSVDDDALTAAGADDRLLRHGRITGCVFAVAVASPDRIAMHMPTGPRSMGRAGYRSVTFGELSTSIRALTRGLRKRGLTAGSRAALLVPPSPELVALTFALFEIGVVPVIVDPGIGVSAMGACLARARPTVFIGVHKALVAAKLFGWASSTITTRIAVGGGGVLSGGAWSLADIEREGSVDNGHADDDDDGDHGGDTAAIVFTSGSTGPPKGVVYAHAQFAGMWRALKRAVLHPGCHTDLPTFPLFALFDPALGLTTVVPRMDFTRPARCDPREIIDPVRLFGVDLMFGSPALLNRLGRAVDDDDTLLGALPSLRTIVSAGAPVPGRVISRFRRLLVDAAVVTTPYGATECLPVATTTDRDILQRTQALTDAGQGVCVGRELSGVRVDVIAIDDAAVPRWQDARPVDVGVVGELVVAGDRVTLRYDGDNRQTALAKIIDDRTTPPTTWHRLGDVGYRDDDGALWYCGRKSQRVRLLATSTTNTGRRGVCFDDVAFTETVEGVFLAHPEVRRAALVGVPRPDGSQRAILCIEPWRFPWPWEKAALTSSVTSLAQLHPHTRCVEAVLLHRSFPVDIRHNSKIFRERLALWAAGRV